VRSCCASLSPHAPSNNPRLLSPPGATPRHAPS
jgi:hypothetical protein